MKKICVIGATGHIGSYLCPYLEQAGYDVTGYSRGTQKPYQVFDDENCVHWVRANREEAIDIALESGADVICDLIPYTMEDAQYICDRILGNTKYKNTRLISVGSIWIYGNAGKNKIDENAPRRATDDYGKNKALIEKYLLRECEERGLRVSIVHPGHICGKGWMPVGPQGNRSRKVLENIKKGNKILLPDDGMATLQHVHSLDIAKLVLRLIENECSVGQSFNIVCKEPITLKDYAEMLYEHYGKKPNIEYMCYGDFLNMIENEEAIVSKEHIDRSPNISMAKAKELLDFESIYTEKDALIESIDCLLCD